MKIPKVLFGGGRPGTGMIASDNTRYIVQKDGSWRREHERVNKKTRRLQRKANTQHGSQPRSAAAV